MASYSDDGSKRKHTESEERCGALREGNMGAVNEHRRRSYSREDTPPAPCSVLCGPRSCSTLPSSLHHDNDGSTSPPEPKRRRLWGLRGLVKMFRRRVRRKCTEDPSGSPHGPPPTLRARSASEIAVEPSNRSSTGPYNQGLSVSHDSVFSPESPTEQSHNVPPSLALATRGVNMSELKAALRRRRGDDEGSGDDDPGLPRSPQTSPTTLDVLNHGLKSYSRTTQSTCSDGSLLSMGSSENDEVPPASVSSNNRKNARSSSVDSLDTRNRKGGNRKRFPSLIRDRPAVLNKDKKKGPQVTPEPKKDSFGALSNHSSRASLIESRYQVVDHEPAVGVVHLSHKAAMHKISVRPKRSHGIPHAKRKAQAISSSLPTTPEVNEDSSSKNRYMDLGTPQQTSTPTSAVNRHSTTSVTTKALYSSKKEFKSEIHENARKTVSSIAAFSSICRDENKEDSPLSNRPSSSGYSNPIHDIEILAENFPEEQRKKIIADSSNQDYYAREDSSNLEESYEDVRRLSREKRKDPFRSSGSSNKSSRQKSDPSRLSNRGEDQTRENEREDKNTSGRSSSVEGRLEGHLFEEISLSRRSYVSVVPTHKAIKDVLSRSKQSRQDAFHQERMEVDNDESIMSRPGSEYPEFIMKERQDNITNRLSSSFSRLENDATQLKQDTVKNQKTHSINSLDSCESNGSTLGGRSSTDSLTTTPLLGIYIRSSQSKSPRPIPISKPNFDVSPKWRDEDIEINSGPLSLDSSLNVVNISHQDVENISKALSVDEVGGGNLSKRSLGSTVSMEQFQSSRSASVIRSASVHSPGSTMSRSRKSSLGDELESDSSLSRVSLRPVKREASIKKADVEPETGSVPEFMRIQLNRVENKTNSVIFDTENEDLSKSRTSVTSDLAAKPKTSVTGDLTAKSKMSVTGDLAAKSKTSVTGDLAAKSKTSVTGDIITKSLHAPTPESEKFRKSALPKEEFEQSKEFSEIVVEECKTVKVPKANGESKISNKSEIGIVNSMPPRSSPVLDSALIVSCDTKNGSPSVATSNTNSEQLKEEIILRRPSVMDRSAVLDQAVISSQTTSSSTPPNKHDQPELFKVFARRSFKMKDVELEAVQNDNEVELEGGKVPNEPIEVIKIDESKANEVCSTADHEVGKNLPTLRSISSKKYPGNVGSFSKSPEQKPTVIILSGNSGKNDSSKNETEIQTPLRKPEFYSRNNVEASSQSLNKFQSISPPTKVDISMKNDIGSSVSIASSGSDGDDQSGQIRRGSGYFSKPFSIPAKGSPQSNLPKDACHTNSISKPDSNAGSPSFSSAIIRRSVTPSFSKLAGSQSNFSPDIGQSESPTENVTTSKPVAARVQSLVWPPRSQPNESKTDSTESLEAVVAATISSTPPMRSSLPQSRILSSFSESLAESPSVKVLNTALTTEVSSPETQKKEEPSINIAATRRRLLSGDHLSNNSPADPIEPTIRMLAEARNISVTHSFDSPSSIKSSPTFASKDEKLEEDISPSYQGGARNSIGGSEDWRVLVRQRREDRMKQTKTQDSEDIVIETRPNVSRNSKVLEMASNFQKLQVA